MKVTHSRSRMPNVIIVIVLVSLVFICSYNYLSLSASNNALVRELRLTESNTLMLERKRRALENRMLEVERESHSFQSELIKDRAMNKRAMAINVDLKLQLQTVRDRLEIALANKVGSQ